jgi:hypothetical protein
MASLNPGDAPHHRGGPVGANLALLRGAHAPVAWLSPPPEDRTLKVPHGQRTQRVKPPPASGSHAGCSLRRAAPADLSASGAITPTPRGDGLSTGACVGLLRSGRATTVRFGTLVATAGPCPAAVARRPPQGHCLLWLFNPEMHRCISRDVQPRRGASSRVPRWDPPSSAATGRVSRRLTLLRAGCERCSSVAQRPSACSARQCVGTRSRPGSFARPLVGS